MRARIGAALAGLAALCLSGLPASSQEGRGRPGDFDFYVLALSWSPAFCESTGASRGSAQCDPGRRLGFVVHGLWPQHERGYPSQCDSRNPPRYVIDETADIFPDSGLARHQWRKHGTCSGLDPASYFRAVRRAHGMVTIPEPLQALSRRRDHGAECRARLRGREPRAPARHDGRHLPAGRIAGGPDLPREGPDRLPALPAG